MPEWLRLPNQVRDQGIVQLRAGIAAGEQNALAAKIVPCDGVLPGERMAVRHGDEDILGPKRQDVVRTVPDLAVDDDNIESAAIEPLHQVAPAFVGQKRVAQRASRQGHVEADAKPAGLAATGGSGVDERGAEIGLDPLYVLEENLPGVGRTDAVAMPLEQRDTDPSL
jgi:hypothetical protein